MKAVSILFAFLCVALLSGCVIAERDITEVGGQVQEGLRGGGRIVDRNPETDSFGSEFQ